MGISNKHISIEKTIICKKKSSWCVPEILWINCYRLKGFTANFQQQIALVRVGLRMILVVLLLRTPFSLIKYIILRIRADSLIIRRVKVNRNCSGY